MLNNTTKIVAGLGAAGTLAVSGAALANSQSPAPTPSSSSSTQAQPGDAGKGGPGGHKHTEVTGATKTNVVNAVKAKDAAVSIERVMADPDGSYDVLGTKSGAKVMVEVSKDLKTVEVRTGGPGGPSGRDGRGGPGGHDGKQRPADVTGSTLTSVKSAVKAKDAAVTVEHAFKTPQGGYVALGTKSGQRVAYAVSADFKTVTLDSHGPRGGHSPHGERGQGGSTQQSPSAGQGSASSSASTGAVNS